MRVVETGRTHEIVAHLRIRERARRSRPLLGAARRCPGSPIEKAFMRSLLLSLLAIGICGGAGAALGWTLANLLGLAGMAATFVALPVAMVVAAALWASAIAARNRLHRR